MNTDLYDMPDIKIFYSAVKNIRKNIPNTKLTYYDRLVNHFWIVYSINKNDFTSNFISKLQYIAGEEIIISLKLSYDKITKLKKFTEFKMNCGLNNVDNLYKTKKRLREELVINPSQPKKVKKLQAIENAISSGLQCYNYKKKMELYVQEVEMSALNMSETLDETDNAINTLISFKKQKKNKQTDKQ